MQWILTPANHFSALSCTHLIIIHLSHYRAVMHAQLCRHCWSAGKFTWSVRCLRNACLNMRVFSTRLHLFHFANVIIGYLFKDLSIVRLLFSTTNWSSSTVLSKIRLCHLGSNEARFPRQQRNTWWIARWNHVFRVTVHTRPETEQPCGIETKLATEKFGLASSSSSVQFE